MRLQESPWTTKRITEWPLENARKNKLINIENLISKENDKEIHEQLEK
jgi:hypothetical protein